MFDFYLRICDARYMDDQEQQVQTTEQNKKERVDELDVIGGLLVKVVQNLINKIRKKPTNSA